jgi:peptidoglycan/xylan/chitin deacetylase (PgdA/CDA1 family)
MPPSVPVLSYHAISTQRSAISITPALFEQQMSWLHKNGFQVVSVSKLLEWLVTPQALPARTIALTFDDGFESTYSHAFPVLADFGFMATIFLVSDYCGGRNDWPSQPSFIPRYKLLKWNQVREMAKYGIEFGAHTLTHPRLDQLNSGQVNDEILLSKAKIQDELSSEAKCFAYPYGFYNETVRKVVQHNFAAACSTQLALATPNSDRFALERIEGSYLSDPLILQSLLTPLFPAYIATRRFLRTLRFNMTTRSWR